MANQTTRRTLLKGGLAAAGLGMFGWPELALPALAQGEELVPFTDVPDEFGSGALGPTWRVLDIRTITGPLTSRDDFYTIQHFGKPLIDADGFSFGVSGLVDRPATLSVTAVDGFTAAGLTAGIKPSGAPDMSVVATADATPVAAAGVFTSNKMTAAPVVVTRSHLERSGGLAAAVILNSGNANAATGQQGLADAERMCALSAESLGCDSDHVLVCSTGLIGFELPMDVIAAGIPRVVAARHAAGGSEAARARATLSRASTPLGDRPNERPGWRRVAPATSRR